jgi:hypothetical protein
VGYWSGCTVTSDLEGGTRDRRLGSGSLADFDTRNRRIVIWCTLAVRNPVIEMQVLYFSTFLQSFGNKCMIELLGVHIEEVGISFYWGNARGLVNTWD